MLAGATLTVALIAVWVRLLGAVGLVTTWMLLGSLAVVAVAVVVAVRVRGLPWRLPWRRAVSAETVAVLVVSAVAVVIAVVAGYYLPVWQWDALGYHLPYVNFALQRGTLADLPSDMPYLSTYPHIVEYLFIAWRAMLPDDRLVDLAGVPLGLLGALAVATIARGQGARIAHAVAAGAAWLTLPAVFLQLPTNYVDVAAAAFLLTAAAFLLGPLDVRRVLLAGVAIGLFLGAKPTALLGAALLLAALAFRARREGVLRWVAPAVVLTTVLGAETYVVNLIRHANPIGRFGWMSGPCIYLAHTRCRNCLPPARTPRARTATRCSGSSSPGRRSSRRCRCSTCASADWGWCSSSLCHSRSSAPCARVR